MRAIIICAGEATRWDNYKGTPKHLVDVGGERLLSRTVRQLNERKVTDVWVVVKEHDPAYKAGQSMQYEADLNPENGDADKFLSSRALWSRDGRTVVFYGDVYFTDTAMSTIVNSSREDWTLFCRPNGSCCTGKRCGECFAQSFYPQHIEEHEVALWKLKMLYQEGKLNKIGGWSHYRVMVGLPPDRHEMRGRYVEIDDFSEDFDFPVDYQNWHLNKFGCLPK